VNAQGANNTKGKVQQLQKKLYLAAKQNSKRKFHALYDKVYRMDILEAAWERVRSKGGAGGVDGVRLADIEAVGAEELLRELAAELAAGTYRPSPVKRQYIPKGEGKVRPLGIPVIRDRIVQMAAKLVLEPIFEADFKDCSYGFRPKRSARQALEMVRKACNRKGWWVVEADIQGCFDTINQAKLLKLLAMRVCDRRVNKLVRQWLRAGVMTEFGYEATETGSPQGGVISPLLANIYLNYLDMYWEKQGRHLGTLVRYADDFVIVCRTRKDAGHALKLVKEVMRRLELTLHPEKTRLVHMWEDREGFDFLGLHHRNIATENSQGQSYYTLHQFPSKKARQKMRVKVKEVLGRRDVLWKEVGDLVRELNPILRGWRNYYGLKIASKWLNQVDWYIIKRFTIWYNKKRRKRTHLSDMGKVRELLQNHHLLKLAGSACCR
jgi:group II intron reverse transcriptase/maturase